MKPQCKILLRLLALMVSAALAAFSTLAQTGLTTGKAGAIKGRVADKANGQPVPFANIIAEQNGKMIAGTVSDINGYYIIKPLVPSQYNIKTSFIGYKNFVLEGVMILTDSIKYQGIYLDPAVIFLKEIVIVDYCPPLISGGDHCYAEPFKKSTAKTELGLNILIPDSSVQVAITIRKNTDSLMGFRFYPNPTTGSLTVEVDGRANEFFVADISGKILQRHEVKGEDKILLDLSDMPVGTYLIMFEYEGNRVRGKIEKVK